MPQVYHARFCRPAMALRAFRSAPKWTDPSHTAGTSLRRVESAGLSLETPPVNARAGRCESTAKHEVRNLRPGKINRERLISGMHRGWDRAAPLRRGAAGDHGSGDKRFG